MSDKRPLTSQERAERFNPLRDQDLPPLTDEQKVDWEKLKAGKQTACGFCEKGVYRGEKCPYCEGTGVAGGRSDD